MQVTNFAFRNELKSVQLQFGKNTDGFYVAGVKKPNDFVNGYCEIVSMEENGKNIYAIQDTKSHKFFTKRNCCAVEEFDNAFLVYLEEEPKGDFEFWYRFDTELCGGRRWKQR